MRTVRDAGAAAGRARGRAARGAGGVRRRPSSSSSASSRAPGTSRSRSSSTATGTASTSGERDCSIQRRHQKVLEEAARPRSTARSGHAHGRCALALAGAVGYVGAGTCEFLLDDRGDLHVPRDEHAPPGRASGHRARHRARPRRRPAADRRGEPLGFEQAGRHASTATRSRSGSTPRTPRTDSCRRPGASSAFDGRPATGVRVDAGIDEGDEVGGRFDPMLAKVIAHGADRAEALARLTERPRSHGRPGADDEPAVPALARPRAGRPRRPGAHRHARPDLAAGRLGDAGDAADARVDDRGDPPDRTLGGDPATDAG